MFNWGVLEVSSPYMHKFDMERDLLEGLIDSMGGAGESQTIQVF